MNLLSHRGLWKLPEEKNTLQSFRRSFESGFGIETDVRDYCGNLVISHDIPNGEAASFDDLLQVYLNYRSQPVLALNIKSDGLQSKVLEAIQRHGILNYFVFDMSVPDTLSYVRSNMPFAARISEYEPSNVLANSASWIWLDAFNGEWFDATEVYKWLDRGKNVVVVSPELHRRPHLKMWSMLSKLNEFPMLYLCTDLIFEAEEFFHAKTD